MKNIIILLSFGCMLSVSAQTQRNHSDYNPRMTQEQFMQQFSDLQLTKEQEIALQNWYINDQQTKKSMRRGSRGTLQYSKAEQYDPKAAKRRSSYNFSQTNSIGIEQILTPKQYELYKNKQAR
ncbi:MULTISPECIES: hypothetical protein [Weeksella]|uniref:Uncharacterized protein n=1 Tax=Weeksella virosa (strain ATCC 43766 / DSM 16922 / JCM 21250 / CCUG 30538 / CDC 9751 / IAM 14551 / NBRC 16016 / NCTC 11634 / CL345/78) TaxID=865938 RepID=F0P218_WEEVC|nr:MULTISPECIES: hypothetical protein [Weeksella]ADX67728.1 hypothetical protein Weevi_1019 [Weeksella virosa DSM 16922]MDK7374019.1 hypothetical protein [Weeksella virosa]MDK7674274.1 hypothetical protein [Weeksella virosa]SUP54027.1 Uncharacterised protein [Weeksella virosa]VEH64645.1 Uncharacterised protein [Weeksella virosa]